MRVLRCNITSSRLWTWRWPRRCWEKGHGARTRSGTWHSTAGACAVLRRPVTTAARGASGGGLCQPVGCGDRPVAGRTGRHRDHGRPGAAQRFAASGHRDHGDSEFCQRAICQTIRDGQGEYLFAVKANQPTLMADLAVGFGDAFLPETDQSLGRGDAAGS